MRSEASTCRSCDGDGCDCCSGTGSRRLRVGDPVELLERDLSREVTFEGLHIWSEARIVELEDS